jgi:hypothetical protein
LIFSADKYKKVLALKRLGYIKIIGYPFLQCAAYRQTQALFLRY